MTGDFASKLFNSVIEELKVCDKSLADIKKDKIKAKAKELGITYKQALECAILGESISQGAKSRHGRMFRDTIAKSLDKISDGRIPVTKEWKVSWRKNKPLDIVVEIGSIVYSFSTKTCARERAEPQWTGELELLERHCLDTGKTLKFIALTKEERGGTLGSKLSDTGVRYYSILEHDAIVRVFEEFDKDIERSINGNRDSAHGRQLGPDP